MRGHKHFYACVLAGLILLVHPFAAIAGPPEQENESDPQVEEAEDLTAEPAEPVEMETEMEPDETVRGIAEGPKEQGTAPLDELSLGEPVEESGADRPFFNDLTIDLQFRSFYFHRDKFDDSHAEAWAVGGSLALKTGYLFDRIAFGAVVYTSQPVNAPDDRGGTGILQTEPGDFYIDGNFSRGSGFSPTIERHQEQDGYTVLGQAYLEVKLFESLRLTVGRSAYNTPYVNMHDVRMTPKTFQGISLTGTREGRKEGSEWRYGLGYLDRYKDWTETDFDPMSEGFGIEKERGLVLGGVNYSDNRFSLGAINYYSNDVINIFYTEGSYGWRLSPMTTLKLSAQFTDQRSVGDDLITGESFDVQHYGVKADLGVADGVLTLAYTDTSSGGGDMRGPWGGFPGYTSVQVNDFNRAGESAFMAKVAYDFTNAGLPGFSAYALYVHGWDREGEDIPNEEEWNFNLQWTPPEGKLEGLSARLRYSEINRRGDEGDPSQQDFRFIVNYNFALKKAGKRIGRQ